jgi:predicted PurR-regulated permease PerM
VETDSLMDNQQLFNLVVSVAGFLAIYVINTLTRQIQRLEDTVNTLPHDYVQKDDYRNDIKEIKQILTQIFDKLDNKADK